jgi:hypothetical protein
MSLRTLLLAGALALPACTDALGPGSLPNTRTERGGETGGSGATGGTGSGKGSSGTGVPAACESATDVVLTKAALAMERACTDSMRQIGQI